MARNAEKAMTTLARWRAAQVQEAGGQRERRPYLASECNSLQQAEKWRLQIVREIAKKVAQIQNDYGPNYNEIFTKMNENELRIRVPKTTKLDRTARYDRIQELCSCETTPYNTGDQIQLELPKDNVYSNEYAHETNTSHVKYAYKSYDRNLDNRNRKIINVTPPNCNIPVNMEKQVHPRKDVFILKIGKKLETKDKKTDLEIELVTPKAPVEKAVNNNDISQQCSCNDMKHKPLKKEIKEPTKKGKKSKTNLAKKKGKTQKKLKSKKTK